MFFEINPKINYIFILMIKILLILLIIILFYIFYFTKKNNEYYSDISQTSSSSIIKDIDIDNKPLVTKSIFEKQNYLIITPKLKNISKLKNQMI